MTTADEDRIAARQAKAIELRVSGKTIREIAKELDISLGLAHSDIRTVMTETAKRTAEDVDTEREIQLQRLDGAVQKVSAILYAKLTGLVADGTDELAAEELVERELELKLKAVDRLVKLEQERAKLLGTYAPEKRELAATIGVEASPAEAARLIRERFGGHAMKDENEAGDTEPGSTGKLPSDPYAA